MLPNTSFDYEALVFDCMYLRPTSCALSELLFIVSSRQPGDRYRSWDPARRGRFETRIADMLLDPRCTQVRRRLPHLTLDFNPMLCYCCALLDSGPQDVYQPRYIAIIRVSDAAVCTVRNGV